MAKSNALRMPVEPLDMVFEDLRVVLEARRAEYQSAADRIRDIIESFAPRPRVGRPPKKS